MKIEIESFSVIYSIDGEKDFIENNELTDTDLWNETEDGESDYVEEWLHKKYGAILTPEQFKEFTECEGLYAENVETMGSLGAPGYGFGWAPAISFNGDNYDGLKNAYVTPNVPDSETEKIKVHFNDDPDLVWFQIRKQVLEEYGY